jgi:hypothetical protein
MVCRTDDDRELADRSSPVRSGPDIAPERYSASNRGVRRPRDSDKRPRADFLSPVAISGPFDRPPPDVENAATAPTDG